MKNLFAKIKILGGLVIIITAIVVGIIFVFYGREKNTSVNHIDLTGTWVLFQKGDSSIDNELLVFDGNQAIDYRNNKEFATSKYTSDSTLKMPDISKEFVVTIKSDNYVVLTESNTIEWKLARVSNGVSDIPEITIEDIVGEYDVVLVAGEKRTGETMNFSQDSLSDIRNGREYLSCKYSLDGANHLLRAEEINKEFRVFNFGKNVILIDCGERYVWELIER